MKIFISIRSIFPENLPEIPGLSKRIGQVEAYYEGEADRDEFSVVQGSSSVKVDEGEHVSQARNIGVLFRGVFLDPRKARTCRVGDSYLIKAGQVRQPAWVSVQYER